MATDLVIYASTDNRQIGQGDGIANWDALHDAASGDTIYTNYDDPYWLIGGGTSHTASLFFHRGFMRFDASTYVGRTITGAVLSIYPKTLYHDGPEEYPNIQVTEGVQHSPVILTDYGDQLAYTTVWGEARYDSLVVDTLSTITFNATGIAAVQTILDNSGIIKLCIRSETDVGDHVHSATGTYWTQFHSAQKGGDYRPKLTLSYAAAFYPSDDVARVSSIRHIYRPGMFRMQLGVGDLGFDIDVTEALLRREVAIAKGEVEAKPPAPPMLGIPCPTCGALFSTVDALIVHMEAVHGGEL